jgi:hypothetical protein
LFFLGRVKIFTDGIKFELLFTYVNILDHGFLHIAQTSQLKSDFVSSGTVSFFLTGPSCLCHYHVDCVNIRSVRQEQPGHVVVALLGGHVQRRLLHFGPGVALAAGPQEDLGRLDVAVLESIL